ncbi:copper amine oxidase N-terminal domain-containing protein [Aminipila luticellarii]|uniref:Copper amine oxidase N-terminal domain-containing protein n=1 Tax=Aminipila luticellarii TaxID=2507160 RepID=A0A410PSQ9_9FIRM|nr:copper amine oxidase N-terminal domain-containing protein [Aminipila luticellarii]QAT41929.1 copper amine oxidase N-terminal domain-containing protein [Aminipila luticellarii]
MKKKKRIIGILLMLSLVVGTSNAAFASEAGAGSSVKALPTKVIAYVKPEFAVQLNQKLQIFKDVKGQRVYPIVYNGNTYLPVRAISAMMDEDVQWDNYSKTVYIGKTLNNPNKSKVKKNDENKGAAQSVEPSDYLKPTWKSAQATVQIRPDITIMYDFEIQKFKDISGNRIYPLVYEGSTYLPIRSVSELMNEEIQWDDLNKTVVIGQEKETSESQKEETIYTKRLKTELEDAIELYDQANAKIVNLQKSTDSAMKVMLADSISADVRTAEQQTITINSMKRSKMTENEQAAQKALYDLAQISENYLLVLENIAYLSSSGKDYSMLSDTFVNFALDSQSKMNIARKLINAL